MVRTISLNVLAKGQVVIPKTIRDMLGINEGDEVTLDIEDGKIVLSKKQSASAVFEEMSRIAGKKGIGKLSAEEIKRIIESQYEES